MKHQPLFSIRQRAHLWIGRFLLTLGIPLLVVACGDGEAVQPPPEVANFTFTLVNNTKDKIIDLTISGMPIPIKFTLIEPGASAMLRGKIMEISPRVTVAWTDPTSKGSRHSVDVKVAKYISDRFNGAFTFTVKSKKKVTFSAGKS